MKKLNQVGSFVLRVSMIVFYLCFIGFYYTVKAQNVAITDNETYTAENSAMLDVMSTNKGMLVPRLTSVQRSGISNPVAGLIVYDTNVKSFMYFNGNKWITIPQLSSSAGAGEALFAVVNHLGDTVFAVYNDGVRIFVDPEAKGTVGGFAISGRTPTKLGEKVEYFRVTPDSTRIYVNDSIGAKGTVGGFAISGRTPTKGSIKDYITINRDSTRIYIDSTNLKGSVGGFAISGRTPTKAGYIPDDYFKISSGSSAEIIPSDARIAWYPKKEAFLAGRVLVQNPDSVGLNAFATGFHSRAKGNYSQAFGYLAIARGNYSTAIGYQALAHKDNSFAFGRNAQALASYSFALGDQVTAYNPYSYSFGRSSTASGDYAVAIGNAAIASGLQSFSVNGTASGDYSKSFGGIASGNYSLSSGYDVTASGLYSTAIGYRVKATNKNAFAVGAGGNMTLPPGSPTYTTASGENSIAIGTEASASGLKSIAFGDQAAAINENTVAIGKGAYAIGKSSICIGNYTFAHSAWSTVLGYLNIESGDMYNIIMTDPLFVIGNGFLGTPSNALTILKNGKMGILNPNPTYYLDVSGTARTTQYTYLATTTGNVGIGTTSTSYKLDVSGTARTALGTYLATSSGNVGIGTTSASYQLDVAGTARTTLGTYLATSSGNVGIGTTSASYQLDVAGTVNLNKGLTGVALRTNGTETLWYDGTYFSWGYGGTYNFFDDPVSIGEAATSAGYFLRIQNNSSYKAIAYSWVTWSDSRVKKDQTDIQYGIKEIMNIKPKQYIHLNSKFEEGKLELSGGTKTIGLIAQELFEVIPEAVVKPIDDSKELWSINYEKLTPVLIKSIQEQQLQLEDMKKENEILKKRIDQLETLKSEFEAIKVELGKK